MGSHPEAKDTAFDSKCGLSSERGTSDQVIGGDDSRCQLSSMEAVAFLDSSGFHHKKSKSSQVVPQVPVETGGDDHQFEYEVPGKQIELEKLNMSKQKTVVKDDVEKKFDLSRQFDIIPLSGKYATVKDHQFYVKPVPCEGRSFKNKFTKLLNKLEVLCHSKDSKPSKNWIKRIQHEWTILEKDLPESIYVRAYEERMDLLRAVIVGAAGTPYQDGLFFFDVHFPLSYPNDPPRVHYHSRGFRLNPNLYSDGTVCLSLLGTWSGRDCEMWKPDKSTMLQVLVSIQGLVLNENPYYNEPIRAEEDQEELSLDYNMNAHFLSCRTMFHILSHPPKHFEDFVKDHFHRRGQFILDHCKTHMEDQYMVQVYDNLSNAIRRLEELQPPSTNATLME